jgi:hypothetical protein
VNLGISLSPSCNCNQAKSSSVAIAGDVTPAKSIFVLSGTASLMMGRAIKPKILFNCIQIEYCATKIILHSAIE